MDTNRYAARQEIARRKRIMRINLDVRKWMCGLPQWPTHELTPIFWWLDQTLLVNASQKIEDLNEAEADQILHALSVWKEGTLREKLTIIRVCAGLDLDQYNPLGSATTANNACKSGIENTLRETHGHIGLQELKKYYAWLDANPGHDT